MRERIDPLIEERAPWLASGSPLVRPARLLLNRALQYEQTVALGERLDPLPIGELMDELGRTIARDLTVTGLSNIPRHGPAMIVASRKPL